MKEEGGERGQLPAHYILYTRALLADLGLLVNGHVPADETATGCTSTTATRPPTSRALRNLFANTTCTDWTSRRPLRKFSP